MSEALHLHRLAGFEPDNLLAFLALLGLLRSLESARPTWRPRAAWDLDRAPLRPILLFAEPARSGLSVKPRPRVLVDWLNSMTFLRRRVVTWPRKI